MVIYVKLTSQILKYEKISIFKNDLGIAYKLNIYKYDSVNKLTSELIEIDNLTITGNSLTLVRIENEEIEMYLKKFMLNLKPVQRRRFKMYFIDNLTYRQIADIESRNIKSIYESVQAGKKKFLKYLDKHPNKNTPTSLSL